PLLDRLWPVEHLFDERGELSGVQSRLGLIGIDRRIIRGRRLSGISREKRRRNEQDQRRNYSARRKSPRLLCRPRLRSGPRRGPRRRRLRRVGRNVGGDRLAQKLRQTG